MFVFFVKEKEKRRLGFLNMMKNEENLEEPQETKLDSDSNLEEQPELVEMPHTDLDFDAEVPAKKKKFSSMEKIAHVLGKESEDLQFDLPFRYRQVTPMHYGLDVEEVLN